MQSTDDNAIKHNRITTTDNCSCTIYDTHHIAALRRIANKSIKRINEDNSALFLLPDIDSKSANDISKEKICTLYENEKSAELQTHNIVGILMIKGEHSADDVQLRITSRFDSEDKQYFFQYMLEHVFDVTLLKEHISYAEKNIFSIFLAMLFPHYLKKAIAHGIYKEYRNFDYNDARVRGNIDIPRHIKYNTPFVGNIAYTVRLHALNNRITQLIRYTMLHLRRKGWLFGNSTEFQNAQRSIYEATADVGRTTIDAIVRDSMTPIRNPYFIEYEPLRKLCLSILRHDGLAVFADDHTGGVHGILFDCAWLWEEYLNTMLKPLGYEHPRNKDQAGGVPLYDPDKCKKCYPDFYKGDKNGDKNIVLDAKYKRYEKWQDNPGNGDLYQMITYLHILQARRGALIFPHTDNDESTLGTLAGHGGVLGKMALAVQHDCDTYDDFSNKMQESEDTFRKHLKQFSAE